MYNPLSTQPLLMVFARNPLRGSVKQRLAVSLGADKALIIYKHLLHHTLMVAKKAPCAVWLWYAGGLPMTKEFSPPYCALKEQSNGHLGQRMAHAFATAFAAYAPVLIIGSDCWSLSDKHIAQALKALESHDYVLGPAQDGGYYLLGMRCAPVAGLFAHTEWGTASVCQLAMDCLAAAEATYFLLERLVDIDYPDQIPPTYPFLGR